MEFEGTVTRIMSFGAFLEFVPGREGMVHISELEWKRVEKVEDVVPDKPNLYDAGPIIGKSKVMQDTYKIIARFQGGPNAGHTIEFEGHKHVLHTIPSGIFNKPTFSTCSSILFRSTPSLRSNPHFF